MNADRSGGKGRRVWLAPLMLVAVLLVVIAMLGSDGVAPTVLASLALLVVGVIAAAATSAHVSDRLASRPRGRRSSVAARSQTLR